MYGGPYQKKVATERIALCCSNGALFKGFALPVSMSEESHYQGK